MNFLTLAYKWCWVTKVQLKTAVANSKITAADYKTITGEDYSTAAKATASSTTAASTSK